MSLSQYVYIIPLLMSLILVIQLFWLGRNKLKLKSLRRLPQKGIARKIVYIVEDYLIPSKKSAIYSFYEGMLNYTKFSVAEFFTIKLVLVVILGILISLIHYTNISIYTDEIVNRYDYQMDEVYNHRKENLDKSKALEEEVYYLRQSIKVISPKDIKQLSKEEIQGKILLMIMEKEAELELPPLMLSNKIYYRLKNYYSVREINYTYVVVSLLIFYFLPDLIAKIFNYFILADLRKELRFLKRLIILNGSIKPVNFMEVLSILIDKSKYHRKFLKEIESLNKKNTICNSTIYRKYIEDEKDINVKLFLEKLDQANNYNFDQAIKNIENEFNIEKRQRTRNVKRQIEVINAWGIVGCFLLIGLLTMYMLIPWLGAYNMNQMF